MSYQALYAYGHEDVPEGWFWVVVLKEWFRGGSERGGVDGRGG